LSLKSGKSPAVFSEVQNMSDAREALEMMREVAKIRIDMLQNRNFYLREYREKLKKIEEIMRRMNIRLVHGNEKEKSEGPDE
jgi:hypothetical protein